MILLRRFWTKLSGKPGDGTRATAPILSIVSAALKAPRSGVTRLTSELMCEIRGRRQRRIAALIDDRIRGDQANGHDACPHRQRVVLVVVLDRAAADLRRHLIERQTKHRR